MKDLGSQQSDTKIQYSIKTLNNEDSAYNSKGWNLWVILKQYFVWSIEKKQILSLGITICTSPFQVL